MVDPDHLHRADPEGFNEEMMVVRPCRDGADRATMRSEAPGDVSVGTGVIEEYWMARPLEFQPLGERELLLVSR
jgi:hypothetical protein